MTLREFGSYISEHMSIMVLNQYGLLIAVYDGRNSIPDDILDRKVRMVTSAQINTIWIEVL